MSKHQKSIAFFPSLGQMAENPYWNILVTVLEKKGFTFNYETPEAFSLKWLIKNRDCVDVLHIHYVHQFYRSRNGRVRLLNVVRFALSLIMARILGFRTVFTLHNLEPTYFLQPAWLDNLGHHLAATLSERVIVHCEEARRLLAKKYRRNNKVFVVAPANFINFYNNTISKEVARRLLNFPDHATVFTFLGGIRPNKGVETLIDAFLKLNGDNLRLVIVGKVFPPESYAQSLKEMTNGDARISFFLEYIPDDEIQIFLNATDIVVLPFAKILTSSSAMLAMSFGCPLIVPRMGCLPELVEPDAGWLYEPNNSDALSRTMQVALGSDMAQAGRCALSKIMQYSAEGFAAQTLLAYFD